MEFSELMALAAGHIEARAIQTAVRLKLFEALGSGERSADSIAREIGTDGRATGILCDALAALGLLAKHAGGYALEEVSRRYLLEGTDEWLGGMILFDEALFGNWSRLDETLRTGGPVRTPDMFQSDARETQRFIRAMDSLVRARGDARYLASTLDLSGVKKAMDIGGGPGTYMVEFLRRWPELSATIYDLPATLEVTSQILNERAADVADRIVLQNFDYNREELPPNEADLIFLSNIIHSESPATNQMLMRKLSRGLASGGRVMIKDHIMNAALTEPKAGAVFALHLVMFTEGRNYSFEQVREWLKETGFCKIELRALPSPPFSSSLAIAVKA